VLAFFIVVAATSFNLDNITTDFAPNGFDGVVTAASIIFFAYIGFDAISTGSEEARNPRRDLPLAIVGALLACTVLYILTSVTAVGALPAAELAGSAVALEEGSGISWAASLVAFGALVAITSVMISVLYATSTATGTP
jgi:APA family basic amino acid/polyamine antiporter